MVLRGLTLALISCLLRPITAGKSTSNATGRSSSSIVHLQNDGDCDPFPELTQWFPRTTGVLPDSFFNLLQNSLHFTGVFYDLDNDHQPEYIHHLHNVDAHGNTYVVAKYNPNTDEFSRVNVNWEVTQPFGTSDFDSHGLAICDLNKDGLHDYVANTGAAFGTLSGPFFWAELYLGQPLQPGEIWAPKGGQREGGQRGLDNWDGAGRGRTILVADFNGDSELDVLYMNEVREAEPDAPAFLAYNDGNSRWNKDLLLKEYFRNGIIYDDQDNGQVLLAVRDTDCNECCSCGGRKGQIEEMRMVMYKWNQGSQRMDLIAMSEEQAPFSQFLDALDIDGDQKLDVFQYGRNGRLRTFLTSAKKPGDSIISRVTDEVPLPCCNYDMGMAVVADLNLDGSYEIFALYTERRSNRIAPRPVMMVLYNQTHAAPTRPQWQEVQRVENYFTAQSRITDIGLMDYNSDGFLDIIASDERARVPYLFKNMFATEGCNRPNFVAVVLKGTVSNIYGIGATLKLTVSGMGPNGGETKVFVRGVKRVTSLGTNRGGTDENRIVFGLGHTGVVEKLEITWPSGIFSVHTATSINGHLNNMLDPYEAVEPPSGTAPPSTAYPTPLPTNPTCDVDPTTIAELGSKTFEYFTAFKTWDDAQDCCKLRGGNLLTVESLAENDFAANLQAKIPNNHAWIGLRWKGGEFQWADTTKASNTFLRWGFQQPASGNKHGAILRHDTARWVTAQKSAMRRFLCEVPSGGTPFPTPIGQTQEPTASPISCDADPNTIAEVGGKTVEYFTNFKTWDDAQSCCEERKGNLLTVESAAENDFAKNLQLKTPMLHAWIGLRWNGDQFQWADEAKSSNDFLAWGLQQPAMTTDHAAVQRHDTGKWVSVGMTARRRFLCEVPGAGTPMPTMSSPTQEPTMCSPTQEPTTSNPTQELTTSSPTQAPSSAALPITRMCAEGRITTTDLITPERLEGGTTASLSEIDVNLPNLSTFYMCRFTFDLDLTENESTICSTSDDGSKVFLNGEEVVDNDGRHPVRTVCSDPIQTSGGAFVVDFFQLKGKSILNVTINGMTPGELLG